MTLPRNVKRAVEYRQSRFRRENPDGVPVVITGQAADGWYLVKRDGWPISTKVPAVPHGAKIPWPRRHTLLFEDGNPQRPFLYWPWPEGTSVSVDGFVSFYTYWLRIGASAATPFVLDDLDEDPNPGFYPYGTPVAEESREAANVVRSQGSVLWWIEGNNLHYRDDSDDSTGTTDMGGEVHSLTLDAAGASCCIVDVEAGGPTEQEAYDDGYSIGFADTENIAFSAGEADCDSGNIDNYDPEFAYDNEPGYPPTPPSPYNSPANVASAWQDGHRDGWYEAYGIGFEDSGDCVIPS